MALTALARAAAPRATLTTGSTITARPALARALVPASAVSITELGPSFDGHGHLDSTWTGDIDSPSWTGHLDPTWETT
jgi:hypothetical protein